MQQSNIYLGIYIIEYYFFWKIRVLQQLKNLSNLCELDIEPSAISHPHKDSLFLVKEESGVEISDDFLVPVVAEL
jgi:hypothetical protein